ncbi:hypothetical protein LCGC14_2701780, partial [marine sediment metagenome]
TAAGAGGSAYDPDNYTSSTEVDCRAARVQDASVADLPYGRYWIYLVPIQYDASGTKILYNGVSPNPDAMSFIDIGV